MKKSFMFLAIILLLTGCKNQLKCTQTTEDDNYKLEQKIIFNVGKKGNIKSTDTVYTMIFEDENSANDYFYILNSLDEDYNIEQNKNKIIIKDSQDYSSVDKSKNELKEELEKKGYTCK